MADFLMPSLGADMDSGTVIEWLVAPGDEVHRGDIVAVVDTAKAAIEVECFTSGTVEEILVPPGTSVAVGTPLARIGSTETGKEPEAPTEPAPVPAPRAEPPRRVALGSADPPARAFAAQVGVDLGTVHGTGRDGRITHADVERARPRRRTAEIGARPFKVSPYARRLATERGIDLGALEPSAADGALHARDLPAVAPPSTAPVAEPPRHTVDPAALRQTIATLMARSKREIPHYYLSTTIDLKAATDWLREHNLKAPIPERIVPAALLLKATAVAARKVPELNGHWIDGAFRPSAEIHLGVAVAVRGGGLIAPAIADADQLSLPEMMRRLRDLVSRARSGSLRSRELTTATLTVTDLGDNGVESVHGVIHPPQVALVGFGAISRRPFAVGDLLGVRPLVTATLAGDHRATDGATGARFLKLVTTLLQKPEEL
ncbi:2-oxo acid dehydrogenase subunit E2 [Amycolatopsis sp. TNS106]|uniref:2-oxo acid dehydrogenase subunit E2 n=1 Tax=Amycolatopsis sp. TNS106 TaxID=2861750 RepID=UPI001C59BAD3|nr:2-oxo acid dehydrogenase subunit E2 [Amycolatopsis sp. TNS106]QXV56509.1 dehydrogenase [Amycolatopsis sp. TNS106]